MKIAVVSDNGTDVSQHFGRAPYYAVFTVVDGTVTERAIRQKMGHQHFAAAEHHAALPHSGPHGYDPASQDKHARMANSISDCQVLIAGGMGWGAFDSLRGYGIETIITDVENAEAAVQAYLQGSLANLAAARLH